MEGRDRGTEQWAARAVGGRLMIAAGVLVSGITALSDLRHESFEPTTRLLNYVLSALAVLFGLLLLRSPGRVPYWLINVLPSISAIMVCIPTAVDKSPSPLGPLLLTWPVTFAAAVLSARTAWITMGVVASAFAVLASVSRGVDGVVLWVEVCASLTVICWMVTRLQAQSNRLRTMLANLARTDELTELINRRGFDESLAREHSRHVRGGPPMGLLLIDIDHFKRVNDSWGHQAGDQALRQLGALLSEMFRTMDVVGRIGGEEFGVLIPDCAPGQAARRAQELCDAVRTRTRDWPHPITVSVGVATSQDTKASPDELFALADAGLYAAKAMGRDRVGTVATPSR
ncbi:GGDEF domain-containing protein [Actinospica sp.]|jgi:diguanylate cyclase (GGDEF)-like protein|uniref:GGDEF domain-containing protein n=1 Tax=Actinospica sp. TaxID=1872142 RepID=UPI002C1C3BE5|nr:GGDEF domain-containing protein [Actinospica sp.]HWG23907.1 GGDEF domain-containing protein [Actinospica sp.]